MGRAFIIGILDTKEWHADIKGCPENSIVNLVRSGVDDRSFDDQPLVSDLPKGGG